MATNRKTTQAYGCPAKGKEQIFYDRWAFANSKLAKNAPPRHELFRKIAEYILPGWFEWHDWTLKMVDAYCYHHWNGFTGSSGSAKTFNAASIACVSWLCAPRDSSVILCSTTMPMLKKRLWPIITKFHHTLREDFGKMMDSETIWQADPGDRLHAIAGYAVSDGNVNNIAFNLGGLHTRRQFVVMDEAEAVLPPIWIALSNLYSYPEEFVLFALANARSWLSQFGRLIEPEKGINSVTLDTDQWEGKPQLDGEKSHIVRFDFAKSPNINELDRQILKLEEERDETRKRTDDVSRAKLGEIEKTIADLKKQSSKIKRPSKHLPSRDRVSKRMEALRAKGGEADAEHFCFDRAFPAPEGLAKTVFTATMLDKHGAYGKHEFSGERFQIIGAFDPARMGGDRPVIKFAALGDIGGKMGIEWMPPIVLYTDATSTDPLGYQLARKIIEHAKKVQYRGKPYQCLPENLGVDCSGDGASQADIIEQQWNARICRIVFQGASSKRPASQDDPRPSNEVYKNKRAEMWYGTRSALEAGQIRGVDRDTASEMCEMRFDYSGLLILIEDKKEYKKRTGVSPDLTDPGIMITEVAMQRGFSISGLMQVKRGESWLDQAHKDVQELYANADYSASNEDYEPA